MTHSSQTNGVKQGAARVRHNRPIEGVLEFPLLRDVHEVWFQIFLPKKSDIIKESKMELKVVCDLSPAVYVCECNYSAFFVTP